MLDQEMDYVNHEPNISIWPNAVKYGFIRGLVAIVISLALYLSGIFENMVDGTSPEVSTYLWLLGIVITGIFIVLSINNFKSIQNSITFGQAIGTGMITALVFGIINAIWAYVFYTLIIEGYEQMMLDIITNSLEEQDMSDGEIERALEYSLWATKPKFLAISAVFMPLITGIIVSLITGLIVKTD